VSTVRYILCGAATGYLFLWLSTALLVNTIGLKSLMVIPVGLIGGSLCGYCYAKAKQARASGVVQTLPERIQDSARATAA
jgi:hypothetical protein